MKSDCTTTRELIAAEVDGDLSPARHGQLKRHLASCADCRLEAARLKRALTLLEQLPRPELQPAFVSETLRRARLARQAQETRARRLMRLWALAALTLGATTVVSLRALGVYDAAATWVLSLVPGGIRLIDGLTVVLVSLRDVLAPVAQSFWLALLETVAATATILRALGQALLTAALPTYVATFATIACFAVLGRSRIAARPAHVERTL